MIVRISGRGQYELDGANLSRLDELDTALTEALHAGDEALFGRLLQDTITFVESAGTAVEHSRVVPSDVVVPPEDVTLEEARRFFTDDGLMAPLPA